MPNTASTTYSSDGRSHLLIFERDDGLFIFGADLILDENGDIEETAMGCWKSDVSGLYVSGIYGTKEEALAAGQAYLGWKL